MLAEVQAEALSAMGIALKDPELCNEAVKLLLANRQFTAAAAATLDRGWKEGSLVERSEVAAALSYNGRRSPEAPGGDVTAGATGRGRFVRSAC